jgi:hypothetical protein
MGEIFQIFFFSPSLLLFPSFLQKIQKIQPLSQPLDEGGKTRTTEDSVIDGQRLKQWLGFFCFF